MERTYPQIDQINNKPLPEIPVGGNNSTTPTVTAPQKSTAGIPQPVPGNLNAYSIDGKIIDLTPKKREGPVSSATPIVDASADAALKAAADAKNGGVQTEQPPTAQEKTLMSHYGVDIKTIREGYKSTLDLAKEAKAIEEKNTADAKTKADEERLLAQNRSDTKLQYDKNDANLKQATERLQKQKTGSLSQLNAISYALNPYSATTTTTDENKMRVQAHFDTLEKDLQSQYELANEAIKNGDTKAYNDIITNINKSLDSSQKTMADTLNQLGTSRLSREQLAFNEQKQNQTLEQQSSDNYRQALTTEPLQNLDVSGVNPADLSNPESASYKKFLNSSTVVSQGIAAGFTPQQVYNDIVQQKDIQFKQQALNTSASRAQQAAALAQEKYYGSLTNAQDMQNSIQFTSSSEPYIDSSNFKGNQFNQARSYAFANSVPFLAKSDVDQLKQIDIARNDQQAMLDQLNGYLQKNGQTWSDRVINSPKTKLSTLFQSDPVLGAFNSWSNAAIREIRALAGSAGLRINQTEISNALNNDLIQPTDTVGVANQKAENINTQLDIVKSAILGRGKSASTSSSASTAPKKGDSKDYQGATYTFDGSQWIKKK